MGLEILFFMPALLLLVLANYTEKRKDLRILTQVFLAISVVLIILEGLLTVELGGTELASKIKNTDVYAYGNADVYGYSLVITGLFSLLFFLKPIRKILSKHISIDAGNWLHATALVFAVMLVGVSLATALTFDIVALGKEAGLGVESMVLQDVVLVAAALLGVGWLTRRDWKGTLERLGLTKPSLRDLSLSITFIAIIFGIGIAGSLAGMVLGQEKGPLDTKGDPTIEALGGVTVITAIIYAFGAGISEEILFRGAMQPRFGIILTSIVFALMHIQYFNASIVSNAISIISLGMISVALGYERKMANTTACIITHSIYDLVLFLMVALAV